MFRLPILNVAVIALVLGAPIGFAQNIASPPAQLTLPREAEPAAPNKTASNKSKTSGGVQWKALQEYWSKSQQKWDACVKESQARKLSTHQGLHFLDECMQR